MQPASDPPESTFICSCPVHLPAVGAIWEAQTVRVCARACVHSPIQAAGAPHDIDYLVSYWRLFQMHLMHSSRAHRVMLSELTESLTIKMAVHIYSDLNLLAVANASSVHVGGEASACLCRG